MTATNLLLGCGPLNMPVAGPEGGWKRAWFLKMKKPESPASGFWRGAGGSNSSKGEFIQTERMLSAMFIYSRN